MKTKSQIESASRRGFLQKLGGVGLSSAMFKLSMLSGNLLWARSALAATAPKRVIFYFVAGGAIPDEWTPVGSETDFTLPAMSAPLESVKQDCVFLNGVNMQNPGHGLVSKVLGTHDRAMTLDLYLARTMGQVTPFSQLQLGVRSGGFGGITRLNWNEYPFEDSPINAFNRLFGPGAAVSEDIDTRRKRSVLDCNLEALNQMRNSLGGFERSRLDQHADAIQRIESRLNAAAQASAGTGGACVTPIFNSGGFSGETNTDVNFDVIADLQSDVATLALQCDLTRVVSIMVGNTTCDYTVLESGVDTNYHASIHGRPAEDYIKYRAYFAKKLQYLIDKLASTEDVDGNSLLDNTIILQVTDMGDARSHSGENAPFMLAGRGGGVLSTGRALNLNGADYNSVLDTVALAMGVDIEGSDYEAYGAGPISGILN